jgi:C4-dicarboxylate-specific signal transduction histidine kinase
MSSELEKEHLNLLMQASALLNSSLNLHDVLRQLLHQATVLIGAQNGYIIMLREGKWVVEVAIREKEEVEAGDFWYSTTVVQKSVKDRSTIALLDAASSEFKYSPSIQMTSIRSLLCTPLIWRERVQGVVYLENRVQNGVFQSKEVSLIEALSQQAAAALENAALYEEREAMYEKALAEARAELASTQAQLINSSKMAAIGELAAGVAHEVNNPLCALAVNLDAVRKSLGKSKAVARVDLMDRAVDRCKSIVERLLTFTHPDRSRWGETELRTVVEETLGLMSYQLKGVAVELAMDSSRVWGCASGLGQVIMNLVQNALQALGTTPEPRLFLRVVKVEEGAQFLIQDNGCGMSSEEVERAFEPFFTTKPIGEGTGLGLSVTYQLLSQHKAKITIDSTLGKGTAISVLFPKPELALES